MTNTEHLSPSVSANRRIQSIEVCRLIASFFIIFIHFTFPESICDAVEALARFAVPFFFIVSGYFAFGATAAQIKKRILGVAKLNVISTLFYILWGTYEVRYILFQSRYAWFRKILTLKAVSNWVFLNKHPFSFHLWYLNALFVCYCAIYVYTRIVQNKTFYPLYQAAFSTLIVHLVLGALYVKTDLNFPYELCRNALFFGFPMFVLGLFLREYQDRILAAFHPSNIALCTIALAGCALTLLERFGFGELELNIGSIITAIAIMLLSITNPQVTKQSGFPSQAITKFGSLSTWIYVTHIFWADFCNNFGVTAFVCSVFGETTAGYLYPILIAVISLVTGIVWELLRSSIRLIAKHHSL